MLSASRHRSFSSSCSCYWMFGSDLDPFHQPRRAHRLHVLSFMHARRLSHIIFLWFATRDTEATACTLRKQSLFFRVSETPLAVVPDLGSEDQVIVMFVFNILQLG